MPEVESMAKKYIYYQLFSEKYPYVSAGVVIIGFRWVPLASPGSVKNQRKCSNFWTIRAQVINYVPDWSIEALEQLLYTLEHITLLF